MKAIIIEEDRFFEIMELIELEAMKLKESDIPERIDISRQGWKSAITEVHRNMHYHFVLWAQSHGASCIREL